VLCRQTILPERTQRRQAKPKSRARRKRNAATKLVALPFSCPAGDCPPSKLDLPSTAKRTFFQYTDPARAGAIENAFRNAVRSPYPHCKVSAYAGYAACSLLPYPTPLTLTPSL